MERPSGVTFDAGSANGGSRAVCGIEIYCPNMLKDGRCTVGNTTIGHGSRVEIYSIDQVPAMSNPISTGQLRDPDGSQCTWKASMDLPSKAPYRVVIEGIEWEQRAGFHLIVQH